VIGGATRGPERAPAPSGGTGPSSVTACEGPGDGGRSNGGDRGARIVMGYCVCPTGNAFVWENGGRSSGVSITKSAMGSQKVAVE